MEGIETVGCADDDSTHPARLDCLNRVRGRTLALLPVRVVESFVTCHHSTSGAEQSKEKKKKKNKLNLTLAGRGY